MAAQIKSDKIHFMRNFYISACIFLSISARAASAEVETDVDHNGNSKGSGILVNTPRESDHNSTESKKVDIRHLLKPPPEEKKPDKKEKDQGYKPSAADRRGI